MRFTIMSHKDTYDSAKHRYDMQNIIIALDGPRENPKLIVPAIANNVHAVLHANLNSNNELDEQTARKILDFAKDNIHIKHVIISTDCHHAQAISICAILMKIMAGSDKDALDKAIYEPDFQTYRTMTNAVIDMMTDEFATMP